MFQQILKHVGGFLSSQIHCLWICLALLEFVKCSHSGFFEFFHYSNLQNHFSCFFFFQNTTICKSLTPMYSEISFIYFPFIHTVVLLPLIVSWRHTTVKRQFILKPTWIQRMKMVYQLYITCKRFILVGLKLNDLLLFAMI